MLFYWVSKVLLTGVGQGVAGAGGVLQKGAVSSCSPQPVITQEQLDRSSPERGSGLWEEVQWERALRPATVTVIRVRETPGRSFFFFLK